MAAGSVARLSPCILKDCWFSGYDSVGILEWVLSGVGHNDRRLPGQALGPLDRQEGVRATVVVLYLVLVRVLARKS